MHTLSDECPDGNEEMPESWPLCDCGKVFACANNKTQIRLARRSLVLAEPARIALCLFLRSCIKKFSQKLSYSFPPRLLQGFEDEIHTVVIQALNAFDKIFPHVVSKYLTEPPCHYHAHQQQQKRQQQKLEQPKRQDQEQETDLHRHSSGQQKRPHQAQTFGQQTFAKDQDNALSSQRQQQRRPNDDGTCAKTSSMVTDNDELLTALLNDFQLQSTGIQQQQEQQEEYKKNNNNSNGSGQFRNEGEPSFCVCVFAISPKLLLSKLRLCHHNKYWLVQNKYAEVISNLNYVLLRSYYANFHPCNDKSNNHQGQEQQRPQSPKDACDAGQDVVGEDIVCTYEVSS